MLRNHQDSQRTSSIFLWQYLGMAQVASLCGGQYGPSNLILYKCMGCTNWSCMCMGCTICGTEGQCMGCTSCGKGFVSVWDTLGEVVGYQINA